MKRVLIASAVLVTTLAAGIFTACSGGDPEAKKKQEGYTCTVTYDANGGTFGSNSTRTYALVKENSLTPAPGYVDSKTQATVKLPTRRNYKLVGEKADDGDEDKNEEAIASQSWFIAKTDENGNVEYTGEGETRAPVLLRAEPWNFARDYVDGDVTLVAMWSEVFRYSIIISETQADGTKTEKEFRTFEVEPGATIVDKLYKKENGAVVRRADYINVKQTGYTLLDFYMDDSYNTILTDDYVHPGRMETTETVVDPETNESTTVSTYTNTVKIYAKYLSGRYDFISQSNLRTLTETSNWYFVEDVDMSGQAMTALTKFSGNIIGNGFTMKNLNVTSLAKKAATGKAYREHSIFGVFSGTISDLTFENVTMTVQTEYETDIPSEQRINFFAYSFGETGALTNVSFHDCSVKILHSAYYEEATGANGAWWEAPLATQLTNVVMKENGSIVEAIKIVTE